MRTTTKSAFALTALMLQTPFHAVASDKAQSDPTIERSASAYLKAVLAGDAAGVGATYLRSHTWKHRRPVISAI